LPQSIIFFRSKRIDLEKFTFFPFETGTGDTSGGRLMVGATLRDSFDSEQKSAGGNGNPTAAYLEAIELLEEEVARLERELQSRDAIQGELAPAGLASLDGESELPAATEKVAGSRDETERLTAELATREDTIRLLLDELAQLEEALAAGRAEWEHLSGWMAELERRVEGQDADALGNLEARLAAQHAETDALRLRSERDRLDWESQRQILQAEVARLEIALNQASRSCRAPGAQDAGASQICSPDSEMVEALREENARLRAAWQELGERTAAAERSEGLDEKLAVALVERHELSRQLRQLRDEMKRIQLEHDAAVADLEARLAQASLARPDGPPPEKRPQGVSSQREIDLRIQALRQNLLEIDQREKEERNQKRLAARLSRLWSRTGPR
jgi:chromosome segregation ATPase